MANTSVLIVATDQADFNALKAELEQRGLKITGSQDILRQVQGEIAEDTLPSLQKVDGVKSVEKGRGVRIPPPRSPVQ